MNFEPLYQLHPDLKILLDQSLAPYTYTKIGGPADVLIFPKTVSELQAVVEFAHHEKVPLTIIGNASNLIVRDGGIRGIVVILTDYHHYQVENDRLIATSGASLIEVSEAAYQAGLTGLEFACGIPGSIGGAIYMNAGAYGGEVAHVVQSVDALTRQGQLRTYTQAECEFSYRHSLFQDNGDIILSVTFQLQEGQPALIREEMDRLNELRRSKQPLEYPSCGSVFKRPEGYYTGKLIQDAGLQGYRIGGAEVSTKHAGFIINRGGATASDYIELIQYIQAKIYEVNQVRLETEVRIIGEYHRL